MSTFDVRGSSQLLVAPVPHFLVDILVLLGVVLPVSSVKEPLSLKRNPFAETRKQGVPRGKKTENSAPGHREGCAIGAETRFSAAWICLASDKTRAGQCQGTNDDLDPLHAKEINLSKIAHIYQSHGNEISAVLQWVILF